MQGQDGSGYFVRLGPAPDRTRRRRATTSHDDDPPRPKKRQTRVNFRFRPLTLIGLLLLGWLGWAATTPGGVSARVHGISNKLQSLVDDATTDPGLKRAANYYNQRYTEQGAYPQLSEQDLRDDPDAGWGVGVDTEWCSRGRDGAHEPHRERHDQPVALAGKDLGDVHGLHHCPADLTDPLPWKLKRVDRGSAGAARPPSSPGSAPVRPWPPRCRHRVRAGGRLRPDRPRARRSAPAPGAGTRRPRRRPPS